MWHWYTSWANTPIYFPQMLCEIHLLLHISVWFFWVTFFITILKCATAPVQFNFSIQGSRKQIFNGHANPLQNCVYREIRAMSQYKCMLIGASLSKPHTGWSLSWFRTSHVQIVRTIKYSWQAIQVLSWFRTLRVWTVRTIKYDGQAIQCFIRRVCRLWVLRDWWSEGRET